ncbi:MAG: AMP-binding protein, partial [Burkholderiaceae bacterium]|nr:AMP-binding protein [Burkholderiaceae bacterium]
HQLVHRKVQAALGFDQARILLSGAAPIAVENLEFFTGLGLLIGEVYGQSEDCGPTAISLPGFIRLGAAGKTLPGMQVRIAEDGEILVQGPNVFLGYRGRPEATAEALQDGWLHSGDLGRIDEDGFIYVTGRKKDLLITSGGKNISPGNIEADLMNLPLVEHAVVIGDSRHFLSALLTLKPDVLQAFAQQHQIPGGPAEWARSSLVQGELQRGIDAVNAKQARVAHVRKFSVLQIHHRQRLPHAHPEDPAQRGAAPVRRRNRGPVPRRHQGLVNQARRALQSQSPTPPTIMGRHSHCPMLMPSDSRPR